MADFTVDSKFNSNAKYNRVVFSGDSPILEAELNEAQQIKEDQIKDLAKSVLSNGIKDLASISTSVNGSTVTVTITDTYFNINGVILYVDSLEKDVLDTETLYLKIKEDTFDKDATVKEYGNQQSSTNITNEMLDVRYASETTRRKQIVYDLDVSNSDGTYTYLEIGSNSSGVFTKTLTNFTVTHNSSKFYGVSSSGNDTYVVDTPVNYQTYQTGMTVLLNPDTSNTGACTVNVDGLGVKNIKVVGTSGKVDPSTGDIIANGIYQLIYDGTDFVLTSPNAILQSVATAQGDILYASGVNTFTKLAKGTVNQTLKINEAGTLPNWDSTSYSGFISEPSRYKGSVQSFDFVEVRINVGKTVQNGIMYTRRVDSATGGDSVILFGTDKTQSMAYQHGAQFESDLTMTVGEDLGVYEFNNDVYNSSVNAYLNEVYIDGDEIVLYFKLSSAVNEIELEYVVRWTVW